MADRQMQPQTNCRYFSGYRPCGRHEVCSEACPLKSTVESRILVIHLGALGAVLRTTSILPAIKRMHPKCHITWITSPTAAPLLENNSYIDRLLRSDHQGTLELSSLSFDFSFCIDKSLEAAGLLRTPINKGKAFGFGVDSGTGSVVPLNPEAMPLWILGLSNHEKFFVNQKTEAQLITESLGLEYHRDRYVFSFTTSELEFQKRERHRLGLLTSAPVIGLNTGCSQVIPYKKLSVEGWCQVLTHLSQRLPNAKFLLLGGGTEDQRRNRDITFELSETVNLTETPCTGGLRKGMTYTNLCDVVVTGDSLGMHMAIALQKWVVCWFGPTCAHEIDFYEKGTALLTEAECSPCWRRHCDKPIKCFDRVDFAKIADAVVSSLYRLSSHEKDCPTQYPELSS